MEIMVVDGPEAVPTVPVHCGMCRDSFMILLRDGDLRCPRCSWHISGESSLASKSVFAVNLPRTWQVCWLL